MASGNPLASVENYEAFAYSIQERFPQVKISTLVVKRAGKLFAELSGQLVFDIVFYPTESTLSHQRNFR